MVSEGFELFDEALRGAFGIAALEVLAAISLLCYLLGIGSSTVVGLRSRRGAVAVLVWMSGSGETVAC